MKRVVLIVCFLASVSAGFAQTQQGYVKTKGRLGSNGQVIAGVRLTGATVRLKGQNVVSQASGTFSFVVSNKKYTVLDIQKKDYQLYDREQLRDYSYSSNPLILVLEKPEDRESDKLMAQQKISRTLRRQLQQREDELERLKEENKITQQEYQRVYNELYSDEKKNQELIESMAEKYASMDFDQMDEENRKIKTLILNGELQKADSIINTKGSIEDRIASYKAHKEANKQEEQELAEREERLQKSKAVENLTLNEIAEDCMNKHEMYKLRCMFDSAAYYIQMRAELDTLNWDWQFATAFYYQNQNAFVLSEKYYIRSLKMLKELVKSNPQAYESDLASSYNNLAILYSATQRFSESEEKYKSALAIRERLAKANPQAYESDLAGSYNNLAMLYSDTQRFSESEEMYKSALKIYSHLYESNPQIYKNKLKECYYWLGNAMIATEKIQEAKEPFMHSLNLARKMTDAEIDSVTYSGSLYFLSIISFKEKDYASAYKYNVELLPLLHSLYIGDAERWKNDYSGQLVSQSFYANLLGKFKEGEQYAWEAIKVDSTQHVAYTNLAAALLFQGRVEEAEKLYRQYKAEFKEDFLDDFAEFERLGVIPEERKKDVERIKAMLNEP